MTKLAFLSTTAVIKYHGTLSTAAFNRRGSESAIFTEITIYLENVSNDLE